MQWNDKAIILSVRRLGENAAVIHLLSADHGMYGGVDKGAHGRQKRGIYQQGNIVAAHWQARLSEQLGMFSCELVEPVAAHLLHDRRKLAALSSATLMTEKILPERERQPHVYACMETLVRALCHGGDWLTDYVLLEFALLEHAGFGLDLARCASTGQTHDLFYVSPRTGRAVSRAAGEPYHDRMFKLPAFLATRSEFPSRLREGLGEGECTEERAARPPSDSPRERAKNGTDITQILDGIRLCGHFLQERVFMPRNLRLPGARGRFVDMLNIKEFC